MNKEEIIKNAKEMIDNCNAWLEDKHGEYTDGDNRKWFNFEKKTIKGLLKLYQLEKEKNKKLEEEVKCFRDSYEEARIEECDNYFMLNRIINLMAEDLKKNVDVLYDTNKSITDIKAYYFNKVKEKKDATKNIG